jgi:two-component system, OmpR family, sensor histidine kinase VicK
MSWLKKIREQPWRISTAAVAGLLVASIFAGLVGLLENERVKQVTDQALRYDIELEDEGDDLRAAVLDMRHYHRNIAFTGPSRRSVADFEDAYARLQEEIGEFEDLGVGALIDFQPEEVRWMAEEYYAGFRPAIDSYKEDPEAFVQASDRGLVEIGEMEMIAQELDGLGEERAEVALESIEQATATARLVLLAVIGGLVVGGAVLAYSVVRVVGELRKLYAGQQATAKKLAEVSQAKTDFIADVSHELRTPLTVLRGNAEVGLILEHDGDHAEILKEIVEESGRMTRMVEDLLFLARSDGAAVPLDLEPVPVASFLAEVAGRAEVLTRERGAELEIELPPGEGELEIDRERVEQAILILVDNAAKYGPPDGRVMLTSATVSGELCVMIVDEGPGIHESELPHIFERFYRIDKMRARKQGGTGLGLPIAKTIIEAHGGRIEAESRVGEGTRMSIYLPLYVASPSTGRPDGRVSALDDR